MKRSELNSIIEDTIKFMEDRGLPLPPFAYWGVPEWKAAGKENEEIVENMLGWDITDFGSGDFEKIGLTIFTFRNGNFYNKEKYPKPYAEKLLYVNDGQILPFHYHWSKMEDIINRGGGDLEITLYNCTEDDFKDGNGVHFFVSFRFRTFKIKSLEAFPSDSASFHTLSFGYRIARIHGFLFFVP